MKKILIPALVLFSAAMFAQSSIQLKDLQVNVALAPNATVVASTVAEVITKIDFDIKNISSSTQYYQVKRYDILLNTDASAYFCFSGSCYGDQTLVSPTSLTLTAGQSASEIQGSFNILTTDLWEGPTAGNSLVKYTFINSSTAADSVQISIKYSAAPSQTVSVHEVSKTLSSFEIFPNPAKETASILIYSPKVFESRLVLFNSLGEIVYTKNITVASGKNTIDMNVGNLPGGVYFASIQVENSTISKRLIIN